MFRFVAAALGALLVLAPAASAQAPSGAPWGARGPVVCPSFRQGGPPSVAQAAQLLRCNKESASSASGELWLLKTVDVRVGGAVSFASMYNEIAMPEADTRQRVYPINGGWTWSICTMLSDTRNPGRNCREVDVTRASGVCWKTRAGEWRCTMNGTSGPARYNLPPVR